MSETDFEKKQADRDVARRSEIAKSGATVSTLLNVRTKTLSGETAWSGGNVILSIGLNAIDLGTDSNSKVLAEEVVRRWNSHNALYDALKGAVATLAMVDSGYELGGEERAEAQAAFDKDMESYLAALVEATSVADPVDKETD